LPRSGTARQEEIFRHEHEHRPDPAALAAFHADVVAAGLDHLPAHGGALPVDSEEAECVPFTGDEKQDAHDDQVDCLD
jgi:hypothetical protein